MLNSRSIGGVRNFTISPGGITGINSVLSVGELRKGTRWWCTVVVVVVVIYIRDRFYRTDGRCK